MVHGHIQAVVTPSVFNLMTVDFNMREQMLPGAAVNTNSVYDGGGKNGVTL